MFFLMQCHHHADKAPDHHTHRPAHREWVGLGGNGLASVLIGSAMRDENGHGNFGILETTTKADAHAFAQGDPINRHGIVREISLIRLADGFQHQRIDRMIP
ncbi:MAG: hypothetical protein ACI91Z_001434 [Yoonia sp.]|jgi:uncharacterized protein YciI